MTVWYVSNEASHGYTVGDDRQGNGTSAQPYYTIGKALQAAANTGDTLIINGAQHAVNGLNIGKAVDLQPSVAYGTTLTSGNVNRVLSIAHDYPDATTLGAFILDGGNIAQTGVQLMAGNVRHPIRLDGTRIINVRSYGVGSLSGALSADVSLHQVGISTGNPQFTSAVMLRNLHAGGLTIDELEVRADGVSSAASSVIDVAANAPGCSASIRGVKAWVSLAAADTVQQLSGIRILDIDNAAIADCALDLRADSVLHRIEGIYISTSRVAPLTANNAAITNTVLTLVSRNTGHGIQIGEESPDGVRDNRSNNPFISQVTVTASDAAALAGYHGIFLGSMTGGEVSDCDVSLCSLSFIAKYNQGSFWHDNISSRVPATGFHFKAKASDAVFVGNTALASAAYPGFFLSATASDDAKAFSRAVFESNELQVTEPGAITAVNVTEGSVAFFRDNRYDTVSDLIFRVGDIDTWQAAHDLELPDGVENLNLSGVDNIRGIGNGLDNVLTGNSGHNLLDGRGGADTLAGGAGDDRYYVDNSDDVVTEREAEGNDAVYSRLAAYTLGQQVERLYLVEGSAAVSGMGNALGNLLTGNRADNILNGGEGADTLTALAGNDTLEGGPGADKLYGGLGDDTFVVDNTGDVLVENAGEGVDSVFSSVSLTLKSNIENLTLTGTAPISAYGNSLDNILTGNSGHNVLEGKAGSDYMAGGSGNDRYYVDNAGDVVAELAGEGNDAVYSRLNAYALTQEVERLYLIEGSAAVSGAGNALGNVLTGNSAGNVLDGREGADTMIGGLGDDRYYVDNTGDVVTEGATGGDDYVYSRVDYSLRAGIERLYLIEGSAALKGTGNERGNVLTGNRAANVLKGGLGNDSLIGGLGNDTYVFGRGDNADTLKDIDATAGNTDVLSFLSGVAHDQLWFQQSGTGLVVRIIGTSDKVTVQGWFGSANNHVEQIRTVDGNKTLLSSQVQNLVTVMAAMAVPAAGQTSLTVEQHAALDAVIAASWS